MPNLNEPNPAWDYFEVNALQNYASYLINGDASGLEDGEAETVDAFFKFLPKDFLKRNPGWEIRHISGADESDDLGFRRCDICNLLGDCTVYRLHVFNPNA